MEEASVLILAPIGRDGPAVADIISRAGIAARICRDHQSLTDELGPNCLAVVVAEEGLFGQDLTALAEWTKNQPAWSDLPFIVLTSAVDQHRIGDWRAELIEALGNVTLLERPVQTITLISSIRAGVRARKRQYDLQGLLNSLEHGNERFRLIAESATDYAIVLSDRNDVITDWLPGAAAVFGWSETEMLGQQMSRIFTPEDRANGVPEQELARAREEGEAPNIRWHMTKDDGRVFIDGKTVALRNADRSIRGYLKIGKDVTERQRNEERQAVLLAELQHRVRNVLAIIAALIQRSDVGVDTKEYRDRLSGRISAMARTQALLTRGAGVGVDLGGIVREELGAQSADETRVSVSGPAVKLSPKAAEVLTLAIHELATNAAKYGAIRAAAGRIEVKWDFQREKDQAWVRFQWLESGVETPTKGVAGKGFGTQLITRRVPYELKGRAAVDFKTDGVHWQIELPLTGGDSVLQTDAPPASLWERKRQ